MMITGIEIHNFRSIRDLSILEFDRHANLFVGKNGAGKSSLLDAISNVMSWFVARMLSNTGRGRDIAVNDIGFRSKEGAEIRLQLDGDQWSSLYRSKEIKKDGKSDLSPLNALVKTLRESIEANPQTSVPVYVHYGVGRVVADIPLRIRKNPKRDVTNAYVEALESSASFRDFFAWFREQEDLENEYIRENPQYRDRGMEAIRDAMSKVFSEFSDMRVRRSPRSIQIKKEGDVLRLEQLSDGEKCYIALVCDLTRRLTIANPAIANPLDGAGIVLIDEIDLHLHPEWQMDVVTRLITTFPNCQFFVTTHSPIVASDVKGRVFVMERGQAYPRVTYGKDSEQILASAFGVANPRNKTVQGMMDDAYTAIREGRMDAAKGILADIASAVGQDDPVVSGIKLEMARRSGGRK
ncbi:MAG: AAA family ATPase [Bacteroidales bacterium]|nr:AAA family ATPase [Bacteroidales bacterium]